MLLPTSPTHGMKYFLCLLCFGLSINGYCETLPPEESTSPAVSKETSLQTLEPEDVRFAVLAKTLAKDNQVHWLNTDEQRFLALFKPVTGASKQGAILIVADYNHHPDWPGPVRYLRNKLPLHGWATLSLALPLQPVEKMTEPKDESPLSQSQANPQLTQRLQAAMTQIQSQGLYNIVVIAIGNAAPLTARSLVDLPASSYAGFIALAPWSLKGKPQTDLAEIFTDLTAGVLELVPALWPESGLIKRKGLAEKKHHPNYSQVRLLGDIKHFQHSPQLLPRIRGWLKRNAEAMEGKLQQEAARN